MGTTTVLCQILQGDVACHCLCLTSLCKPTALQAVSVASNDGGAADFAVPVRMEVDFFKPAIDSAKETATRAWRTVPPEKRALLVKHAPKAASAAAGGAVVGYGVSFLARRRQRRLQRQLDALDAEKGELEKRLASANEQAELLLAQGARSGFQEAAAMSKSVAEATAAAARAASAAAQAATACNRGPPACARSASSLNAVATPASSHGGAGAGPIQPPLAHPSVLPP